MASNEKDAIAWYQEKIGAYDQQIWEKSLEQTELKGLRNKPKKRGRIKADLIDVDLLRGSTFSKAKPESPWTSLTRKGLVRVLFFPVFFQWWIQVTSKCIFTWLLLLYCLQVLAVLLYLETSAVNISELVGPMCLMLLLGTVHCQIVSTESSRSPAAGPARRRRQLEDIQYLKPSKRYAKSSLKNTNQRTQMETVFKCENRSVGIAVCSLRRPRKERSPGDKTAQRDGSLNAQADRPPELQHCLLGQNDKYSKAPKRQDFSKSSVMGVSDDYSSEDDAELLPLRRRRVEEAPADSVLRSRRALSMHNSPLSQGSSRLRQCLVTVSGRYGNMVFPAAQEERRPASRGAGGSPRRPSDSPRLGSDTDDMLCEELLQGPDSASSGSSDSGEGGPWYNGLPPAVFRTTEEDLLQQQSHLSWLQSCHPSTDRVSTIVWENGECKKVDMSVLEISAVIMSRVKDEEQGLGYLMLGGGVTVVLALLPLIFQMTRQLDVALLASLSAAELLHLACGPPDPRGYTLLLITLLERVCLSWLFFFMMCVAERTYKQRLLFAKLFSHLTSARKAKKSEIPHFRLKNVQNVKIWLSLRSFLKRRGPQRSVDVIVSSVFLVALSIAFVCCAQFLQSHHTFLDSMYNWELLIWESSLVIFLLRLATLGSETNRKYSNMSVLLTEQINLYLKMEKKPSKKEELNIVNNVLKLATKLMKELDTPFRLYGLTVNPLIYNITRVVILSAVSGVVSDLLGINIRLWKIKP
uniref:Putative homeodomain transcription factor 1 n=1 Tax=Lepisosteus oculatus TaxID=7918 RepID=W5MXY5_LEPOC